MASNGAASNGDPEARVNIAQNRESRLCHSQRGLEVCSLFSFRSFPVLMYRKFDTVPVNQVRCGTRARARLGGAMPTELLDLLGPPGRCSGSWPHDGEVAGGAVAISF
jgi:hypothetical protein